MKRLPTAILAAASAAALVGLLLAPKGHPASSQEAHPGRTGRAVDRRQESEAAPDDWMVSQRSRNIPARTPTSDAMFM